tara:strand:- start:776 stop:1528 length:753 start_codon:yes stop_codon:yes gene_type:complete
MNKNIFMLIILVFCFFSCNLIKKNTIEESCVSNPVNSKELIEKVNSENISPEWISLNAKIEIDQKDNNTQVSAQIRVKKDSVIWISVKAPLGIEIFRTMITPDSIYYMSRMNKTYLIKPISDLKEVIKTDISYDQLQDILFASPQITKKKLEFSSTPFYYLKSENNNYIITMFYRIIQMELKESENKSLTINFNNYKTFNEIDNHFFPSQLLVKVLSNEVFDAEINYTKIKFNKTTSISFKIPKSYVPIN